MKLMITPTAFEVNGKLDLESFALPTSLQDQPTNHNQTLKVPKIFKVCFCMLLLLFTTTAMLQAQTETWTDADAGYDITWYTDSASTVTQFHISTPQQLAGLAVLVNGMHENFADNFSGKTITLTADIDLVDKFWTPIGTSQSYSFQGTFSGGYHTISNMEVDIASTSGYVYAGLFGYISTDGKVENLHLQGNVNGSSPSYRVYVGGVVGYNSSGSVQNCSYTGTVSGSSSSFRVYVGGVVGYNTSGIVQNCNADCTARAHTDGSPNIYVGGITAYNENGKIYNNYARGLVEIFGSYKYIGGITGYHSGNATYPIQNNYFEGTLVTGTDAIYIYKGGIVGRNNNNLAKIQNNYWKDNSTTPVSAAIGGGETTGTNIKNNAAFTETGTFASDIRLGTATAGDPTYTSMLEALNAWVAANQITPATYSTWEQHASRNDGLPAFTPLYWIDYPDFDWYNTSATSYTISTPNQLAGLAAIVNNYNLPDGISQTKFSGKTITLADDINLRGKLWTPIGISENRFDGTFSGAEKTIRNMEVEITANGISAGLFGYIDSNGVVKKLHVQGSLNISITSSYVYAGGIVGLSYGIIQNCSFTGNTSASTTSNFWSYAGGIAGYNNYSGIIQNCSFYKGSIASASWGTLSSCAGGIVGRNNNSGIIRNCTVSEGNISSKSNVSYAGGIVGYNNVGYIYNNYARGSVTASVGTQCVGGIAGYAGGDPCSIQNNYFEGTLTASGTNKGGVVGYNNSDGASIQNNYWQATGTTVAIGGSSNTTGANIKQNAAFTGTGTFATDITAGIYTGIDMLKALIAGAKAMNIAANKIDLLSWKTEADVNSNYPLHRAFGTDTTLTSLAVNSGTLDPAFAPGTYSYNVTVGHDVGEIVITAVATDTNATIADAGGKTLGVGINNFNIVVTAESGLTKATYTVNVYRQSNDTTLSNLTVSGDGILVPTFASNTFVYYDTVAYATTTVNIAATANHTGAVVAAADTGRKELLVGDTTFKITVTAEDDSYKSTYIVNIHRKSNDTTLSALTVNNHAVKPTLSSNTFVYYDTVSYATTTATISATANHVCAVVAAADTGTKTLNVGDTTFKITVTAEDNSYKSTYIVNIHRQSNDTLLSSLTVSGDGILVPTFASNTFVYYDTVAYAISSLTIGATAIHPNATVVDTGRKELLVGDTTFKITVTAEDATYKSTYIVNIHRKSNDTTLSALTVNSKNVKPTLSPGVFVYYDTVSYATTTATIAATANHAGAVVAVADTGSKTLNVGDNSFTITVTAEDNSITGKYTVNIHRQSNDTLLATLTVNPGELKPSFASNTFVYYDTVAYATASLTIEATANHAGAVVAGTGEKGLNVGDTAFVILVIAEDPLYKREYTVNIHRKSNDTTLNTLTVNDHAVKPNLSPGVFVYYDTVAYATTTATIAATANHAGAVVAAADTGSKTLNVGDNSFTINVTAEDNSITGKYTVNIHRQSNDTLLATLTVNPGELKPSFASNTFVYYDTVAYATASLTIGATAIHPNAFVSGTGTKGLNVGDTAFVILVTAEDPLYKREYTVNIHRKSNDTTLNTLTVNDHAVKPTLSPGVFVYYDTVSYATTTATIAATANHAGAVVAAADTGSKTLDVGDNSFAITVTAEDNSITGKYTVNIHRQSNDTTLSTLAVSDGTLTPSFNKGTFNYSIDLCTSITTLSITATTTDDEATVAGDVKNYLLPNTDTTFVVTVTAEDNLYTADYNILVKRHPTYLFHTLDTICEGDTYPYRGKELTTADVYYDSLKTVNGCDSVYMLTLTVLPNIRVLVQTTGQGTVVSMDSTYHCKSSDLVILTITPTAGWYVHNINVNDSQVSGPIITSEPVFTYQFNHNYTNSNVLVNFRKLCPDTVKDVDGNIYLVEFVGCNCWTTTNLKTTRYSDSTYIPFAEGYYADRYPDTAANIATFGRLYDWASASRGEAPDTNGYIQGVCPKGWALPTVADFECLLPLGSDALRENDPSFWLNDHTATNSSGFGAVPAGYYEGNTASFIHLLGEGYIWVGEPTTTQTAQACSFLFGCPEATIVSIPTRNGVSVRCVRIEN